MRRYNNLRRFRNTVRAVAVAFFCYLWFPAVAVSLQAAGAVIVTNRAFVFFFANTLVALIFLLSRDRADEESTSVGSSTEPDLYDQYTSFSVVTVTASDEEAVDGADSKRLIAPAFIAEEEMVVVVAEKQTVPAFIAEEAVVVAEKQMVPAFNAEEVVVEAAAKGDYRRTRSERKKKAKREVTEFRRTESAGSAMEIERLSSEEFRLKVETFIMEKKRSLVLEENDAVERLDHCSSGLELVGGADSSCAASC
ncbi:Uncharacterized protein Rs2_33924 [Raphanus sativus]|nr:Uncharacterized protein Rs2_33924 [Raphanus sativus]